jgi:hypothetical protein
VRVQMSDWGGCGWRRCTGMWKRKRGRPRETRFFDVDSSLNDSTAGAEERDQEWHGHPINIVASSARAILRSPSEQRTEQLTAGDDTVNLPVLLLHVLLPLASAGAGRQRSSFCIQLELDRLGTTTCKLWANALERTPHVPRVREQRPRFLLSSLTKKATANLSKSSPATVVCVAVGKSPSRLQVNVLNPLGIPPKPATESKGLHMRGRLQSAPGLSGTLFSKVVE